MSSFKNSPSLSQQNIKIITRLRGPQTSEPKEFQRLQSQKIKSPKQNNKYQRSNTSKSPTSKKQIIGLNPDTKYTMFTCKQPSNTLIVSSKPIKGSSINETFLTKNDLYDFSQSILKETSLLEFDKVYNETHSLEKIYNENIKDNITNLFHGKNSCVLFFGPIDSGKSFSLRGSADQRINENGILSKAINDIFSLVELTKQANQNSKINSYFIVKLSAYQIYLDSVHDLLSREIKQIKIEQYYDDHLINTNLVNLTQKDIKSKKDYDICIQEAVKHRKNLSQVLKVNELKRKSHLVISILIEKREKTSDGISRINNENLNENYAQIDFVELASSNYGLVGDIDENDASMNGILYQNTSKVFNSISNNIVCSSNNMTPKNESKVTLCLKRTLRNNSNIVLINCMVPWEYPLNNSYKALKFGNWIRNQILNLSENDIMQNNSNPFSKNYDDDNNMDNLNNINSMNNLNDNLNNINSMNNLNDNLNNINNFNNNMNRINPSNNLNNMNRMSENINSNNNLLNQMSSKSFQEDNLMSPGNFERIQNNFVPKSVANNSVNMSGFGNDLNNRTYNTMPNNMNEQQTNYRSINPNNPSLRAGNIKSIYKPGSPFNDINCKNTYSSNDENDIREIREKIRRKYKSPDPQNNMNKNPQNQFRQNRSPNFSGLSNNINSDEFTPEQKLQNLENSLRQLEEKSFEMNQQLEGIRNQRDNINLSTFANRGTVSYLPDAEIEKIKLEHVTLKNDNIILREDMNRLVNNNKHLENELNIQRNRNIELANDNERLNQEKISLENKLKEILNEYEQNKISKKSLEDLYTEKMKMENKTKDSENELNKMRDEKSKYEINYKVLKERFDELKKNFDNLNCEYIQTKQIHNEEISKIDEKVDFLTREIDILQKENSGLRQNEERQRLELNSIEKQRDNYRDKYQEQKNNNDLLATKLQEIETEFKNLMKEKENEQYLKMKEDEERRLKFESKNKLVNELQNKIQNYRNQRLRKKIDGD